MRYDEAMTYCRQELNVHKAYKSVLATTRAMFTVRVQVHESKTGCVFTSKTSHAIASNSHFAALDHENMARLADREVVGQSDSRGRVGHCAVADESGTAGRGRVGQSA